jgi:hypothetical protein
MIAWKLTKLNQQIKTIESLSSQLTKQHPLVTLDQNIGMVIIEIYQTNQMNGYHQNLPNNVCW